jgi:hypothetical protein
MAMRCVKNTLFDPNFRWMLNVCFLTHEFFIWDVDAERRCDAAEPAKGDKGAGAKPGGAGAADAAKVANGAPAVVRQLPRDFLRPAPA